LQDPFFGLRDLLNIFPHLTSLEMHVFAMSATYATSEEEYEPVDSITFSLQHPSLATLLLLVQSTQVLRLVWIPIDSARYIWTRTSAEEAFVGERHRLC
jgi:hypothetical protein